MIYPLAIAALLGIVIGFRYRVWLLLLAMMLSCCTVILGIIFGTMTIGSAALQMVLFAIALQVGFVCGSLLVHSTYLPAKLVNRISEVPQR